MKKFGFLVVLFLCVLAFPGIGHAASGTHINLDGKQLNLKKEKQVQVVQNTVLIPIRVVMEELGYNVGWNNKTSTVTIQQSGKTIKLVVGSKTATVDGVKKTLSAAPMIKNGTSFVPLRFVGEETGLKVNWDQKTKTVYLITPINGGGNTTLPGSNSGNSSGSNESQDNLAAVSGITFTENRLVVSVEGSVTPKMSTLTSPNRIVMDLPNTKFADSFPAGYPLSAQQTGELDISGYPVASKVRYSLYNSSPSTIRIVLDLNKAKSYDLINLNDGLIILDLNKADSPGNSGSGKKLVVIDAGHGGSDPGAISVTKKKEKDFNLAVVLKVEKLLKKEPNINYVLTRNSDTYPSLSERVKIANDLNADLFVSVHGNSGSSAATGVETYYTRGDSAALAKIMHKYLVKATGLPDRKVRTASLHVTRETKMPAVLLEGGFLSNKGDEAQMFTDSFQQRVAEGIVAGIKEYFGY
ncbi:N-acetylmuramoyl-L-alanine amidase [Paenibacillus sp. CAA11]|uniref:N-acetylmuramoyl-L-alanine amidase family protein n=1 Tax=Paenibacillus sp. CAA11 TaxID=1532905 RepID=UPI000D378DE3|nr:N-acetylmuramoyl-L-alanine amidase family protein [Paenibacillus sp. CAA11]AWB44941.1 N-acetylmuramoyl-L-alanine amidase [Paenibacillus sp. CAA11]